MRKETLGQIKAREYEERNRILAEEGAKLSVLDELEKEVYNLLAIWGTRGTSFLTDDVMKIFKKWLNAHKCNEYLTPDGHTIWSLALGYATGLKEETNG